MQFTPQRFDELAADGHHSHVQKHLPQVRLEEAERERRPEPKRRREQVAGRHAEHCGRPGPERKEIAHGQHARYDFDAQTGVVEQQLGVLLDVRQVLTYFVEHGHRGTESAAAAISFSAKKT